MLHDFPLRVTYLHCLLSTTTTTTFLLSCVSYSTYPLDIHPAHNKPSWPVHLVQNEPSHPHSLATYQHTLEQLPTIGFAKIKMNPLIFQLRPRHRGHRRAEGGHARLGLAPRADSSEPAESTLIPSSSEHSAASSKHTANIQASTPAASSSTEPEPSSHAPALSTYSLAFLCTDGRY